MANFEGYLLKAGNKKFPNKYIQWGSYSSTPNQREEIKAFRNDNTRDLIRKTAQGTKTSIVFTTKSRLSLSEKKEIQEFFTDHESNALERKITLTYWNDEENRYKEGSFYRPDITFVIRSITNNNIYYQGFDIELIEY